MLAEGIEKLKTLAVEAAGAKVLQIPGEPREVLVVQGSSNARYILPPPLRQHTVCTLDDLIEFARDHASVAVSVDGELSESREISVEVLRRPPAATAWYQPGAVVLLVDDADRRERVTLPLVASPTWELLDSLTGTALDQGRLMRLFRIEFRDCLDATGLLRALRRIEWSVASRGVREIRPTGESLGKSIEAEVQAVEQLPDSVVLTVPIYDTEGERYAYPVECVLEADALSQRFTFQALPGRMTAAVSAHMQSIQERLREGLGANFGVYHGAP